MAWAFHPEWGSLLRSAKEELRDLVITISRYEPVRLLTLPRAIGEAGSLFGGQDVEIIPAPVDDIWMRGIAPIYAMRHGRAAPIDLNFNGWGNSEHREPRPGDRLASVASHLFGQCVFSAAFIAEGGAFTVDGSGVVYTSKSCLLHKKRNPKLGQSEIERALIKLGASRVVWLEGDEDEMITNGHVDGYVLPTESGDVLVQTADHERDASRRSADIGAIRSVLHQTNPRKIVALISPPRNLERRDPMFAGSYLNVYTPNGAVIMPAFGDELRDFEAERAIRTTFPNREIIVVSINSLATGGGGIRCLVQPVPSAYDR
jgi:agmatine deiminase